MDDNGIRNQWGDNGASLGADAKEHVKRKQIVYFLGIKGIITLA